MDNERPSVSERQQAHFGYATADEIQRVREWDCVHEGHSFDFIMAWGTLDPQRVVCSNCGKGWQVRPEA